MTHPTFPELPSLAVHTEPVRRAHELEASAASCRAPIPTNLPLLRLSSVTRDYGDGRGVFAASLELRPGQVVGLIGANGSGKSTLLRCATFFETIDSGQISIAEHTFRACTNGAEKSTGSRAIMESLRGKFLGTVFQESGPWPHLTTRENVMLPLIHGSGLSKDAAGTRAEVALQQFGLLDRADAQPWQLSGGLRQRLVLARALVIAPTVLFIDEGTSALDPDWTERVRRILRAFASGGRALVVISHQMGLVRRLADRVLFLHRGRVEEEGAPEDIFQSPQTPELQEFLANA